MEIATLLQLPINNNNIKAVIFDCFGTLMQTTAKKKPYKMLVNYLKDKGFEDDNFAYWLMSQPVDIKLIEQKTKIKIDTHIIDQFNTLLKEDLEAVKAYPETNKVLLQLKSKNIKIVLCSNLASDYGNTAKTHTEKFDEYILSYECGYLKPQKEIYQLCQEKVGFEKNEIIFVGDNYKDDYLGSKEFGFVSYWLNRK